MTNAQKLLEIIKTDENLVKMEGAVLYSSTKTLKKGKFYFLGVNPGGDNGDSNPIGSAFSIENNTNSYIDEIWDNSNTAGKAPLQQRVKYLFGFLNSKLTYQDLITNNNNTNLDDNLREICASNLIFEKTKKENQIDDFLEQADTCFKVHERIIDEIVKPEFIITMGRQVFNYFVQHKNYQQIDEFYAGHGNWKIRVARNETNGITLINLPHLSYYQPFVTGKNQNRKEEAMNKLKKIVG